jgi:hypothetical protein
MVNIFILDLKKIFQKYAWHNVDRKCRMVNSNICCSKCVQVEYRKESKGKKKIRRKESKEGVDKSKY